MAYTMKDSPHKRGAIEGTASALKLGGLIKGAKAIYKAVTGGSKVAKGGSKVIKATTKGPKKFTTKIKPSTYINEAGQTVSDGKGYIEIGKGYIPYVLRDGKYTMDMTKKFNLSEDAFNNVDRILESLNKNNLEFLLK
jgi:hypothetical protein|tara:strand:- start:687 stop:1100 length:414 start_codon:yes stop_codon:yes gene_type:complete